MRFDRKCLYTPTIYCSLFLFKKALFRMKKLSQDYRCSRCHCPPGRHSRTKHRWTAKDGRHLPLHRWRRRCYLDPALAGNFEDWWSAGTLLFNQLYSFSYGRKITSECGLAPDSLLLTPDPCYIITITEAPATMAIALEAVHLSWHESAQVSTNWQSAGQARLPDTLQHGRQRAQPVLRVLER